MKMKPILPIILLSLIVCVSCYSQDSSETPDGVNPTSTFGTSMDPNDVGEPYDLVYSSNLIQPEDFEYLGYFLLPESSGESNWEYSGQGLTYYPEGDPDGPKDGFPGSLFGFGHDHQLYVTEISIPEPVISSDSAAVNSAQTLQPFANISGDIFSPSEMTIPRAGLAYLDIPQPLIHFVFGQHFQEFEPSHGWAYLNLSDPDAQGPWIFGEYTNYITNDYLFEIPPEWANQIDPGPLLASGRAREGLWSGRGPALFAYDPGDINPAGSTIENVIPLLLYGEQGPGLPDIVSSPQQAMIGYREADHWWGGEWLTYGDSTAVVISGTKALGNEWYGFANGVVWEHDCAEQTPPTCPDPPEWPYEDRGFWAEDYQAQLIFYDPTQLVAVARGELASWQPQPYAVLVLDEFLLDPELDYAEYKRDLVGAIAFDRENNLLYLVERMAVDYSSVIHVWQISR